MDLHMDRRDAAGVQSQHDLLGLRCPDSRL